MLGFDADLKTTAVNGGLAVELPRFNPSTLPCQHVFTLKITSVQ
jgi:hypothetical protein